MMHRGNSVALCAGIHSESCHEACEGKSRARELVKVRRNLVNFLSEPQSRLASWIQPDAEQSRLAFP